MFVETIQNVLEHVLVDILKKYFILALDFGTHFEFSEFTKFDYLLYWMMSRLHIRTKPRTATSLQQHSTKQNPFRNFITIN